MNALVKLFKLIASKLFAQKVKETVEESSKPSNPKPKKEKPPFKIVIDPGHGGKNKRRDPGAVGKLNGEPVYERDVVLEISIELALMMEELGAKVILTRIDNEDLSHLKDKVEIVKKENPDIFVSIHANSNAGKPAQGIETFYHSKRSESKELAKCIQDSMIESFPDHRNRGIKQGNKYYILKMHSIPACCLVECEFINHPKQVKFLTSKQKEIAQSIAEGIKSYLNK